MSMYMNIYTGSVAPFEEWEQDFFEMGPEEFGYNSIEDAITDCLVEVEQDENGDWIEKH